MKKVLYTLNLFSTITFIIGVLALVIWGISSSQVSGNGTFGNAFYFTGTVLLIGMFALLMGYLSSDSTVVKEVLFVTKEADKSQEIQEEEDVIVEEKIDYSSIRSSLEKVISRNEAPARKLEESLSVLCNGLHAGQGIIYKAIEEDSRTLLRAIATYATMIKGEKPAFELGEGLVGLAAKEKRRMNIDNVPEGYVEIFSGLGKSLPAHIVIMPLVGDEVVSGVLEIAFFNSLEPQAQDFLEEALVKIGKLI